MFGIGEVIIMVADWIVIKSKVKDFTGEYSVSSDFSEVLNQKVKQMIADAVKRAEANSRHTVMGRDL
jgi:histone H3/H4